jgi:hypothetical protein
MRVKGGASKYLELAATVIVHLWRTSLLWRNPASQLSGRGELVFDAGGKLKTGNPDV